MSPQLAIALGRTLLTALIESHAKEAAPTKQPNLAAIEFKGGLLNFAVCETRETTAAGIASLAALREAYHLLRASLSLRTPSFSC